MLGAVVLATLALDAVKVRILTRPAHPTLPATD
jgi:hypothetical protein